MKKQFLALVYVAISFSCSSVAISGTSDDILEAAEKKALNATNGILRSLTSGISESLKNFDSNKDEQTINFGLGYRKLINNDKILLGANVFYDYAFDDNHRRIGAGIEAISSVFDFRSNIYEAESDVVKMTNGSTEEALDGWDARLDYHIPVGFDLRIFGTYFDWEDSEKTYENKGEQYGIAGQYGLVKFEVGYRDEEGNKKKDAFGKISMVIPIGDVPTSGVVSRGMMEMVSVRDQMYEPVERENRIRVVKISSGSIVISGF